VCSTAESSAGAENAAPTALVPAATAADGSNAIEFTDGSIPVCQVSHREFSVKRALPCNVACRARPGYGYQEKNRNAVYVHTHSFLCDHLY